MDSKKNIVIYKTADNDIQLEIQLDKDTVWLSQAQMAELFEKDRNTVSEHIQNIFREGELNEDSVTRKFRATASDGKSYLTNHYNLDVVISVGYRVKSLRGTQFRIWATNVLRDYLVEGYAINQRHLEANSEKYIELQEQLKTLRKVIDNASFTLDQSKELVRIISDYAGGLELIDKVDHGEVGMPAQLTTEDVTYIAYTQAATDVVQLREQLNVHELFGNEKDNVFKSALQSISQTFDGKDLYPSVEEKAANLLYLIIKNHPFTDGNKRIGSFMFVRFLDLNNLLYRTDGTRLVEENALVAIALLIAQSDPKHKELMVRLVVNLIK